MRCAMHVTSNESFHHRGAPALSVLEEPYSTVRAKRLWLV
jgi:hypothetical protein